MTLSKKLTTMNDVMSCDAIYLGKVHNSILFFLYVGCIRHSYINIIADCLFRLGGSDRNLILTTLILFLLNSTYEQCVTEERGLSGGL